MYIPVAFKHDQPFSELSRTVLAGDIGGTKSNLAIFRFEGGSYSIMHEQRYYTKDYVGSGEMIAEFLHAHPVPDAMCFGVAGPVQNGKVQITNVPWEMDSREISRNNGNLPVHLINDLEATAYGIALLKKEDVDVLYEPENISGGNLALIAPGTGLGEAGLYWDGSNYHPFATEGGHSDFGPGSRLDTELYFFLRKRFGHVSWERVISGSGIHAIYEFLHLKKKREIPQWLAEEMLTDDPAAVISRNAGSTDICRETMDMFAGYLAAEAANLALKLKATGGVFIGGGIIVKNLGLLDRTLFVENFQDSGRMKPLLKQVPLRIILNDKAALLGAAFYGAAMTGVSGGKGRG